MSNPRCLTGDRRYSLNAEPHTNDMATCAHKSRFRTKQIARDGRSRAERRGVKLFIYECPVCKGWHLTSTDPTVERERRSR